MSTEQANTAERWVPIPGYEGWYEVSDHGRVRSLDRTSTDRRGHQRPQKGRFLRGTRDTYGYVRVTLSRNGTQRIDSIHALVLQAFIGPCPEGLECRHLNGDQLDCRLSNLRWGTHLENIRDKYLHGTIGPKDVCVNGHELTDENVKIDRQGPGGQWIRRRCLTCERDWRDAGRDARNARRREGHRLNRQSLLTCRICSAEFSDPAKGGPLRQFCSPACKAENHRQQQRRYAAQRSESATA